MTVETGLAKTGPDGPLATAMLLERKIKLTWQAFSGKVTGNKCYSAILIYNSHSFTPKISLMLVSAPLSTRHLTVST